MTNLSEDILADIETVNRIAILPTILDVVCRSTGMGFAALARVTDTRWVACRVLDNISFGLVTGSELPLETTICDEIRMSHSEVVIDQVSNDPHFCSHHTPAMYGFQSYISFPIVLKDGQFFGTLCAIDPRPAMLNNPQIRGMFKVFAELIAFHIQSDHELRATEKTLLEERQMSELRDQFIAVLGHDLRNPLSAVSSGSELLLRMPLQPDAIRLAKIIKDGSARMKGLVENVLDFARGRLGGGIPVDRTENCDMDGVVRSVIEELLVQNPERTIEFDAHVDGSVHCDDKRIAQLFSNLLGNALTYGDKTAPIKVRVVNADGIFKLSVVNKGKKIPPIVLERLFKPFSRGIVSPSQHGLGLGLYITQEIANAHGGHISVLSTDDDTIFTFEMPSY